MGPVGKGIADGVDGEVIVQPDDAVTWMRYLWLIYLIALFFEPVFDPEAGILDWIAVAVMLAIFLPLYVAGHRAANDRQLLLIAVGMAALGAAGSLINGGASVFVIYAAAAAAYTQPVRRAVLFIGALVALLGLMMVFLPLQAPWGLIGLALTLVFTIVTGATNIFDAERQRTQLRLRRADEEIERLAALAERERIARDLHDLLGQSLSVIVVKSELAARLAEREPQRAGTEMRDVERIGREALAEVRAAVVGYRAQGLRAEVTGARRALAAAGVEVSVEDHQPALPVAQESALAMALRESVTNILRHADAQRATIRIAVEGSQAVLEVGDDGRGGDRAPEGSGLMGMRERIAALGGTVQRNANPGMHLRITLPLQPTTQTGEARTSESSGHP